jgi:hypothetical protein
MSWIKKPIKVRCYTSEELGKLLDYQRSQWGLSHLHAQRFGVTAVLAMQYWKHPDRVMYFEVEIPHSMYKKLREKFIEKEVFDPVLEQRAFSQILGREL